MQGLIKRYSLTDTKQVDNLSIADGVAELASKASSGQYGSRLEIVSALCEDNVLETSTHAYELI